MKFEKKKSYIIALVIFVALVVLFAWQGTELVYNVISDWSKADDIIVDIQSLPIDNRSNLENFSDECDMKLDWVDGSDSDRVRELHRMAESLIVVRYRYSNMSDISENMSLVYSDLNGSLKNDSLEIMKKNLEHFRERVEDLGIEAGNKENQINKNRANLERSSWIWMVLLCSFMVITWGSMTIWHANNAYKSFKGLRKKIRREREYFQVSDAIFNYNNIVEYNQHSRRRRGINHHGMQNFKFNGYPITTLDEVGRWEADALDFVMVARLDNSEWIEEFMEKHPACRWLEGTIRRINLDDDAVRDDTISSLDIPGEIPSPFGIGATAYDSAMRQLEQYRRTGAMGPFHVTEARELERQHGETVVEEEPDDGFRKLVFREDINE